MSLRTTDKERAATLARAELENLANGVQPVTPRTIGTVVSFEALALEFANAKYGQLPHHAAKKVFARTITLEKFLLQRSSAQKTIAPWTMQPEDATAFREYLRDFRYADDNAPMSHETSKKRWQAAVALWDYCVVKGLAKGISPFFALRPPDPPARSAEEDEGDDRARGVFTLVQLAAIEALCEDRLASTKHATRVNAGGALVLMYTGARPIEVINLRAQDVNTETWQLRLRSRKSAGSRGRGVSKPITSRLVEIVPKLRPLLAARKAEVEAVKGTFLFANAHGGQLKGWWGSWRKWFAAAGVPLLDPAGHVLERYSFRNSYTAVLRSWEPFGRLARAADIQQQLGHASISTTERYLSSWSSDLRFSTPPDYAAWLGETQQKSWGQ